VSREVVVRYRVAGQCSAFSFRPGVKARAGGPLGPSVPLRRTRRSRVQGAATAGRMGGAPGIDLGLGPQQGPADTGRLGEAFEAASEGVHRCDLDAQSFCGLFGAEETIGVHSDYDT
jgi:hypothetical protein